MLKKTITYKDFNDIERTEDFYFNLTAAEVTEMELSTAGGLTEMIQRVVKAQDMPAIIEIFKNLVLHAYGIKSPDGRRFMKKDPDGHKYADEFAETNAFSDLYMELALDADKAAEFVNGILPSAESMKSLAPSTNK